MLLPPGLQFKTPHSGLYTRSHRHPSPTTGESLSLQPLATTFSNYGILTINMAAEFCFKTEQRQNRSSFSSFRLAETPEVPNTISEDNSLSFPMVHQMAPNISDL
jgi:hypothetical protein